jgi:hypothetical protein
MEMTRKTVGTLVHADGVNLCGDNTGRVKTKLSLCLTYYAIGHEGVGGSAYIDPHFFTSALAGGEW